VPHGYKIQYLWTLSLHLIFLSPDVIAKQIRVGGGFYPSLECAKPPFELPVIYEDDHVAVGKQSRNQDWIHV
jgi:hypothetical protein